MNYKIDKEHNQDEIEVIQQWQYVGPVNTKLLEDNLFESVKEAGITSLQSYVYWAEIEKEPDKINFSSYDPLVEKIIKHDLKWVPFLILGPCYATPKWFQESKESIFASCLEHNVESKIQSIWNPHLRRYIDRFLNIFSEHYQDRTILESILLGISGSWGESIYPAGGGFGTDFHLHLGWWCGDEYALIDYRRHLMEKYEDIEQLNQTYNSGFKNFQEVNFPLIENRDIHEIGNKIKSMLPTQIRQIIKPIYSVARSFYHRLHNLEIYNQAINFSYTDVISELTRQIDFVNWYMESMTQWADFWLKAARKYFPEERIYLVTGGHGEPQLGADFTSQVKIAKKYNAGIRITNQTDSYSESFVYTRLVSTASRYYGSYFTTEEAMINQPHGVTMRIFDAATSGAKGVYFKNIVGLGIDTCSGKTSTMGDLTACAKNLKNNLSFYNIDDPLIETAVLFPNASIAIKPQVLNFLYRQYSKLRFFVDIDLVDENLITDGVLSKHRFLVILSSSVIRKRTYNAIEKWIKDGGIVITSSYFKILSLSEGHVSISQFLRGKNVYKIENGYIYLIPKKGTSLIKSIDVLVHNEQEKYPWIGIKKNRGFSQDTYSTRFSDRILGFDQKTFEIKQVTTK